MTLPSTRFDRGNLDVLRHNVTWKNRVNAANFAADVADVCIARYAAISPSSPMTLAANFLAALRQLSSTAPSIAFVPPVFSQFAAWNPAAAEGKALKALLEIVHTLYWRVNRKPVAVANDAGRWVYTWALDTTTMIESEVEAVERQYRIADRVAPPSQNRVLAFEAVWMLGRYRDAVRLLYAREKP